MSIHFPFTAKEGNCLRLYEHRIHHSMGFSLPTYPGESDYSLTHLGCICSFQFFMCYPETTSKMSSQGLVFRNMMVLKLRAQVLLSQRLEFKSRWTICPMKMVSDPPWTLLYPQAFSPRVGLCGAPCRTEEKNKGKEPWVCHSVTMWCG